MVFFFSCLFFLFFWSEMIAVASSRSCVDTCVQRFRKKIQHWGDETLFVFLNEGNNNHRTFNRNSYPSPNLTMVGDMPTPWLNNTQIISRTTPVFAAVNIRIVMMQYRSVPEYNYRFHINIEYKRSLYLGMRRYSSGWCWVAPQVLWLKNLHTSDR